MAKPRMKNYLAIYWVQTYYYTQSRALVEDDIKTVDVSLKAVNDNHALVAAKMQILHLCEQYGPRDSSGEIPSFDTLNKSDVTLVKLLEVDSAKELFKSPDFRLVAVGKARQVFALT